LALQRGTSGGALGGNSVIPTLTQALHNLTTYQGGGNVQSIADLGLKFDSNGVMSFDSTILTDTAAQDPQGVNDFLGSTAESGFLKTASDVLTSVTDQNNGAIVNALGEITGEITETNNQITQNQDHVDQLQKSLTAQITAADALIASMQQQYNYLSALLSVTTANQNASK